MAEPRAFSWLGSALSGGVINAVINAPLGFLIVRSGASLPLWGVPGIAPDLLAMGFGISFGTGLAVTLQTRRQARDGKLRAPEVGPRLRAIFKTWKPGLLQRAINLGLVSVPIFVPLPLLGLWLSGMHAADQTTMVVFKGVFSFVQGAIATPLIAAGAFFPEQSAPPAQA